MIKKTALPLLLAAGLTLYGYERYSTYESKQDEVRTFQQLALGGYSAVNAGADDKALQLYEAAIAIHDGDDASLGDLATLYRRKGRIEEARTMYEKAYAAKSDKTQYLYNAALCDYILGDHDAVITRVTALMHKDRRRSKYYRLLALSHFAGGDEATALGYYAVLVKRRSYGNDNLLVEVKAAYDVLAEKPKPQPLTFAYEQTDAVPELVEWMRRYEKEGYDIKALRTAQKILTMQPDHDSAHKTAATLFYAHGAMADAHRHAAAVKSPDARSLEILGGTHQSFGEYGKAIDAYERAYAAKPGKELLRAMAVCAFQDGRTDAMEGHLHRLRQIDPQLAHRLTYALETRGGITHDTWEKVGYLLKDDLLAVYCDLSGCGDA